MALTKNDLKQIGEVVNEIVDKKIDALAQSLQRQFDLIDKRFTEIDKRLELIDKRLNKVEMEIAHLNASTSQVQRDVSEIRDNMVYRQELDDLQSRVALLEKKLGVKSGK
ncbi:MAG: hypothetical protein HZA35_03175 [Parcubacteria group bacterium]|nr:hypothetical protein [Parcubacteria group bacterium]